MVLSPISETNKDELENEELLAENAEKEEKSFRKIFSDLPTRVQRSLVDVAKMMKINYEHEVEGKIAPFDIAGK